MSKERRYNRKIMDLLNKVGKLEDREVKKVLALLETARKEVAAQVAATEWQAHRLPEIKAAVERAMDQFGQAYGASQTAALSNMWEAGIDFVDWPLRTVGFAAAVPEISRTTLEIMQGYSADLIKGLSRDAVKQINSEVMLGILGGKQPYEVMQAIGKTLSDSGTVSSKVAHRAETITRTEMANVHSLSREARMQATIMASPEIEWEKKWLASGKAYPRANHAALHGIKVPVKIDFPGGLPYPHAPRLPLKEKVNCGCSHVLVAKDWEAVGTGESMAYQARAIYD